MCNDTWVFVVSAFDSGWIAAISMIGTNLAVAVVMMVVAGFFTVNAVLAVFLLKAVRERKDLTLHQREC